MKSFINKILTWIYGDTVKQFDDKYSQIKQGLESPDEIDMLKRFEFIEQHLDGRKIATDYSLSQDSNLDVVGAFDNNNED